MTKEANGKLDASATPLTTEDFMVKYFIEHAAIYLNDGSRYGPGGAGYKRMNLATARKRVQLALDNTTNAKAAARILSVKGKLLSWSSLCTLFNRPI